MPKRTRKSKKGGKFIGEGSYGCGFLPSLKCVGRPRSDEISLSKMITIKSEAEKEFAISTPILQIDPKREYFITAEGMCEHDQSDIRPNNETDKCRKFPLKGPTYLIMYENGGVDLSKLNIPANLYPEFFVALTNLIEGLDQLHSNGMVHLDIKPDNMVGKFYTDIQKYKIRYIDFGLSRQTATLSATDPHIENIRNFNLKTPYPYYPFDLLMSSSERQKNPNITKKEITHWYLSEESRRYNTTLPQDSYWMPGGAYKYTETSLSDDYAKNSKWYENLSDHLKSIDIYAFGVSLCKIYKRITGHIRGYDENGNIIIIVSANKSLYRIDEIFRTDYSDEIYNFHKNLAVFSMKFYEQLLPLLLPFGNLRPKASDVLKTLGPLLNSTEDLFKNPNLTYKALSAIGANLEKPVIIDKLSVQTAVTNITPPHSFALSANNDGLPPGWETHINVSGKYFYYDRTKDKSQWERPPPEIIPVGWEKYVNKTGVPYYYHAATNKSQYIKPFIKPPMRPSGVPTRNLKPVITNKIKQNPLKNISKLTQLVSNNPLPKRRTRKNRKSN